jgi:hypothetical protein
VPDRLLLASCAACVYYVCLSSVVNASELERLKKRFMKLDRCFAPLAPLPYALVNDSHDNINVFPPRVRPPPLHVHACMHATVMGLDQ